MIRFPNCKINLGLHVLGKRTDGFHNLETIFYPLPIRDALEIIPAPNSDGSQITKTGLPVSGDSTNNLCTKAWHLLKHDFPQLPAVCIHLHKTIPMGAGLGGGSADGAVALQMLNDLFNLALDNEALAKYALQLGSDCPFFLYNQPCFATGRGEVLQSVTVPLQSYYFYIVNPSIHISTGEAFSTLQLSSHPISLLQALSLPVAQWKNSLKNDFEKGLAANHPEIDDIKMKLYTHGALYASMSGSGSTVYGIFETRPQTIQFSKHFFTEIIPAG